MRNLLFILLGFIFSFGFSQDNRTFDQINDSIMREARIIYQYDKAFNMASEAIDANRSLRRSAGEILVMPKDDVVHALIFSKSNPESLVAEMKLGENPEDSVAFAVKTRAASEEELDFYHLKHFVMNNVQAKYDLNFGDRDTYLNPIFFPFKEKIRGTEVLLYKLYLTTETNAANMIPFGRDYMFIADSQGSILYNLQFNLYMPMPISTEISETGIVEIEYLEREPYITPTDIYLFNKYGAPRGLNSLRVHSTALGVVFQYDWDRDDLNVLLEEIEIDENVD